MNILLKSVSLSILFTFSCLAAATPLEAKCISKSPLIEDKLACISGLTFTENKTGATPAGTRVFDIQFEQAVDHNDPSFGTFSQKLALIHRNENEPMILQTSGYSIFGVRQASVTSMFETNQLQVEHRFFSNSKPSDLDWSKLNIKQSADDFHAIVVAFKQIYPMRWVNTGASKGGMTSVYHRRFYPNDLDGTIADVAPLSFSTSDQRYNDFLNNVGGAPFKTCRENFKKIQVELLKNRDLFIPNLTGSFNQLGGSSVAFEHMVIESSFYFWQYKNPNDFNVGCQKIPASGTPQEMYSYLQNLSSISDYSDESIGNFQPYYFQSATELGGPDNVTSHLERLRLHDFSIDQYTPHNVSYTYSNAAMHDVDYWVRTSAERVLFIYGEFDPWSAGEFAVSDADPSLSGGGLAGGVIGLSAALGTTGFGADADAFGLTADDATAGSAGGPAAADTVRGVYKYYVPGGNHGSKYTALPSSERDETIALISLWLNKAPVVTTQPSPLLRNLPPAIQNLLRDLKIGEAEESLEDFEFRVRSRNGLP